MLEQSFGVRMVRLYRIVFELCLMEKKKERKKEEEAKEEEQNRNFSIQFSRLSGEVMELWGYI